VAAPSDNRGVLTHERYSSGPILGEGAQGMVLRVVDREAPQRPLVAKLWRPGRFPEPTLRGEFALLARLSLPFVVRAHDFGVDTLTGAPFLVEDFVPGPDARSFVDAAPPEQRSERLLRVVRGVLRALLDLHEAGFIHGDLKPEHAKVTPEGRVVLIDLGSAVERAALGAAGGSPGYVAPEVQAGAAPSVRSDLYAVGALAFSIAAQRAPKAGAKNLRASARWLEPRLASLIECLIASHPGDRPVDASEALGVLPSAISMDAANCSPIPIGRERAILQLMERARPGVHYLVGPSGIGKTHLAREVWIRALLAGRDARRVTFPDADEGSTGRLVAFFRGDGAAWPFGRLPASGAPFLLLLDPLERAPSDLVEALEAFRCRASFPSVEVLGVGRAAPPGAFRLELPCLPDADMQALAKRLGLAEGEAMARACAASRGNPGWLLALHAGAPVTAEMIVERLGRLNGAARELLASVVICGGDVSEELLAALVERDLRGPLEALSALFDAGLLVRELGKEGVRYRLPATAMAVELGSVLSTFDVADRAARVLLSRPDATARQLLAVAQALCPPERREELLERAAHAARATGLRNNEMDALLALLARADRRSPELLLRLERLTRDAGAATGHPEVLAWLEQAAEGAPELAPLVLRRRAERAARSSESEHAERLIAEALRRAAESNDPTSEAFAHGSAAAIALYRADWPRAERELERARALLDTAGPVDAEELARIEHNAGVVELYAERFESAAAKLERSLAIKRSLGDRGGVRSCLLNLGIASIAMREFARAEAVLLEAVELARSLGQRAGEAWCLAARVELEVRRGDARAAERWLLAAEAVAEAAPAMVRADLGLLRAETALLNGDGAGALEILTRLDAQLLASDSSLQVKALLVDAEARLHLLPAEPRRAARLAIRALRLARTARHGALSERASKLLARARTRPRASRKSYDRAVEAVRIQPESVASQSPAERPEWDWLREIARGASAQEAWLSLCRLVVAETRAERALIATVRADGRLVQACGADLDGFELSHPEARVEPAFLSALLASAEAIYQPDVASGSRLGGHAGEPGGERVVMLLEHRFRRAHFDGLAAETLSRWLTLARLASRLAPAGASARSAAAPHRAMEPCAPAVTSDDASDTTTREPVRPSRRSFPEILGESSTLHRALARLDAAIDSALPVLILGETGCGKELFARALHQRGPRAERPFVAVNCAAIADTLFEAELFGHVRGAFTGADRVRPGLLAHAEGGTLLLDEIGELSLARQATLLRLLETSRYRPVGSDAERSCDIRVVAATNRDLASETEHGRFRRDLLFRLNVLEIRVPSLRERREDVRLLARAFLARAGCSRAISEGALARLAGYDWPGNVRELENVIDRLVTSGGGEIDVAHLPRAIRAARPYGEGTPLPAGADAASPERLEVELALARSNGNITHAAAALGLTRHGLKKRMLRLGLRTRGASRG
jgi:DNA-binding NtrC family response regulator